MTLIRMTFAVLQQIQVTECKILSEATSNGAVKADFQSVLRTLESLFMFFVLRHVRHHRM